MRSSEIITKNNAEEGIKHLKELASAKRRRGRWDDLRGFSHPWFGIQEAF
jgi:hypothetical protein